VGPSDLGAAVRGAAAMGWAGFNCSLPHKVAVRRYVDELSTAAQLIGAVNCVVRRGNRWVGENTDGQGFVNALRSVTDPTGASVLVLGAGGAARAIAVETALADAATITIVNRDAARAAELAALIAEKTPARSPFAVLDSPHRIPDGVDIVVNATSVGLAPDVDQRLDLDLEAIGPRTVVADVIPNPAETHLIRDARDRGATVLDGRSMLVEQAVIGIRHWLGIDADRAIMHAALDDALTVP
jgi:shikimate dehydrogenase